MLTTILPQIVTTCAAAAAVLYLATAKRNAPITRKEAGILWKLHKQTSTCTSHNWKPLTRRKGEITGFKCQCGYRYTQKRPFLSRTPTHARDYSTIHAHVGKASKGITQLDTRQL